MTCALVTERRDERADLVEPPAHLVPAVGADPRLVRQTTGLGLRGRHDVCSLPEQAVRAATLAGAPHQALEPLHLGVQAQLAVDVFARAGRIRGQLLDDAER